MPSETEAKFLSGYAPFLRHCSEEGRWYVSDDVKWSVDHNECRVWDAVKCILDSSGKARENGAIRSLVEVIAKIEGVRIDVKAFDRQQTWVNTEGNVYDMEGGKKYPNRAEYLMTKVSGVAPEKGATPEWDKFLSFATNGDEDFREYLLRLFGYWLSGDTREQKIWFLTGRGRNGKSTLLALLSHLWGDYAVMAPPGLLVHQANERHPTELAGLWGARLAILSEMNPGDKLDVAKMKMMTGDEKMTARFMRGDFFTFDRHFKLVCACNDLPQIQGGGGLAERRRIVVIPFSRVVDEKDVDPKLLDKLKAEGPAILYQIVQAAYRFYQRGLVEPAVVAQETAYYWEDNDQVAEFLAAECSHEHGAEIEVGILHSAYMGWNFDGIRKDDRLSKQSFGMQMQKAGYRKRRGTNRRYWVGLRLATDAEKAARGKEDDADG